MTNKKSLLELESVIAKAVKKVNGRKENDLCKYIPVSTGGYMHHFTLKKLKNRNPDELRSEIEKHILKADRPRAVAPKQRAPRGSRKRKDHVTFSRVQLEKMLNIARLAGDKEMIAALTPREPLAIAKRRLISSIRHNRVELELWEGYVEAVKADANKESAVASMQQAMSAMQ